ncbi:MAG: hypothetical protein IIZ93_02635 [Acidaminococcaceae bacterium]|nr:hypothetical protein [Acidaminococcaceae bacterium]
MSEIMTTGRAMESPQGVVVYTTRPPVDNLSNEVLVYWQDSRARTLEQIRKAWALMGEIAEYQGQGKDDVYREQSTAFSLKHLEILQGELFHLSTATVSTARAFINLLIEIILEYGIPTKEPLYGLCDDIERYVYACLMNKKCAVCGKKTELHHVQAVGMGRNRHEIDHIGMLCLPLCREHHDEAHLIGNKAFEERYHLIPIQIDQKIAKKYNLKGA